MVARSFSALAAAVFALSPVPASAAPPIGGWKIEPSDVRCVAVRQYGTREKPITLALKASTYGTAIQLAVLRDGYQKSPDQTGATIELDGNPFETTALSYPIAGNKRRVTHLINLDPDASTALRTANDLKVTVLEGVNETFPLAPSIGAWRSLQDCIARVRETWNVSEARKIRLGSSARGDLRPLFTGDDYPLRAMMADQSGSTQLGLLIDEQGRVRDCTLIKASGIAMLDSRSCGIIMERARFEPAKDVEGKPVKSSWRQTITWRLTG